MAVHITLEPPETLAVEGMHATPPALNDLLTLASWVAVRWRELDEHARLALVRRIQQVASHLGRQANLNGEGDHAGDGQEVLNRLHLLTPREIQVLQAMADGYSTAKIAIVLDPVPDDPAPTDPISIERGEFDTAYDPRPSLPAPRPPLAERAPRAAWRFGVAFGPDLLASTALIVVAAVVYRRFTRAERRAA